MGIPRTVLPILQWDSTILKNSVQSHGTKRIHGIDGITDAKLGHD